ncbi:MAG: hypothetical protein RL235_608 [Chlamydiota bacterium]|jgi:ribosome-binding protein aMBF1 (putative translation factor)
MSAHTKTHRISYTRTSGVRAIGKRKRASWRDVAKKELKRFSETGIMLRGCRYKSGMTQLMLAKKMRVSLRHISEIENGKRVVGKDMAKKLAEIFDIDYRVFL